MKKLRHRSRAKLFPREILSLEKAREVFQQRLLKAIANNNITEAKIYLHYLNNSLGLEHTQNNSSEENIP